MDVHIYKKKTGQYLRTVRDAKPGDVINVDGEPHEIQLEYEQPLPPTRWPNAGEEGGAEL